MLAVRRGAAGRSLWRRPRDEVYSAVQGALGILIAFVIFLAFQSYLGARSAAQDEATAVLQLFRTAELFPRPYGTQEEQHLVCYARAVAGPEWRAMKKERASPLVDAAVARTEATFAAAERSGPVSGAVASSWLSNAERALGQALFAAAPAVILSSGLVLIYFFDHPYEGLSGSIQPVAMERALDRMTAIQHATGVPPAPCPTT